MSKYTPTATQAWQALTRLAEEETGSLAEHFDDDAHRRDKYSLEFHELYLDFSKNLVSDAALSGLLDLAKEAPLADRIAAMFAGSKINLTENRAVLHTALRRTHAGPLLLDGTDIMPDIHQQLLSMKSLAESIRSGEFRSITGQAFTDVVNIGIGGSDLGPKMVCTALREFTQPGLRCHFLSNVDGAEVATLLEQLAAETTIFIICSKTFTTHETLLNAETAMDWLAASLNINKPQQTNHCIAITAAPETARNYGIADDNILIFWDWVGGRYSLWSAVGLSICISIGAKHFQEFLDGAALMDEHFRSTGFDHNMPVLMAMLGIWYHNFLGAQSTAVIPYCERLEYLPAFLQQLDMESNGKSATLGGTRSTITTGPVLWGQTGTNGQHAFFQLLHQGTRTVPVDFIAAIEESSGSAHQHQVLLMNMIAQSAALMLGDYSPDIHKHYPGNKPSNVLLLQRLDARTLGMLIALYEHKIFVQGVIWDINSYDQWGVELGKRLATDLMADTAVADRDPSTAELIRRTRDEPKP